MEKALLKVTRFNNSDVIATSGGPTILVSSIDLTHETCRFVAGEGGTVDIDERILPANATNTNVEWMCSPAISVDSNGIVTVPSSCGAGRYVVTCTATDGSLAYGICYIDVEGAS